MKIKTRKCRQKFANSEKLQNFEMFSAAESQILDMQKRTR